MEEEKKKGGGPLPVREFVIVDCSFESAQLRVIHCCLHLRTVIWIPVSNYARLIIFKVQIERREREALPVEGSVEDNLELRNVSLFFCLVHTLNLFERPFPVLFCSVLACLRDV
jgi:hypothetical protein